MKAFIILILLLLGFSAIYYSTTMLRQTANPTPEEHLWTYLFNTSLDNIQPLASTFRFRATASDDVQILVFPPASAPFTLNEECKRLLRAEKIVLYVHGWKSLAIDAFSQSLAKNYNAVGGHLVLIADWSKPSSQNYFIASGAVRDVGYKIAETLWELSGRDVNIISRIHVVGHSLGAQVSGFIGKWFIKNTSTKIGRITGLDPAAPLFQTILPRPRDLRLNKDDGKIVDCIITNMGFGGFLGDCGDSDFYVNGGGPIQPACFKFSIADLLYPILCSHMMALEMYINSLMNPDSFVATKCSYSVIFNVGFCEGNHKTYMGWQLNLTASGKYYINTNETNNLPRLTDFLSSSIVL